MLRAFLVFLQGLHGLAVAPQEVVVNLLDNLQHVSVHGHLTPPSLVTDPITYPPPPGVEILGIRDSGDMDITL